jgi:hypothetical protein
MVVCACRSGLSRKAQPRRCLVPRVTPKKTTTKSYGGGSADAGSSSMFWQASLEFSSLISATCRANTRIIQGKVEHLPACRVNRPDSSSPANARDALLINPPQLNCLVFNILLTDKSSLNGNSNVDGKENFGRTVVPVCLRCRLHL